MRLLCGNRPPRALEPGARCANRPQRARDSRFTNCPFRQQARPALRARLQTFPNAAVRPLAVSLELLLWARCGRPRRLDLRLHRVTSSQPQSAKAVLRPPCSAGLDQATGIGGEAVGRGCQRWMTGFRCRRLSGLWRRTSQISLKPPSQVDRQVCSASGLSSAVAELALSGAQRPSSCSAA